MTAGTAGDVRYASHPPPSQFRPTPADAPGTTGPRTTAPRPTAPRTTKNPRSGSLRDRGSSVREGGVEPPRPFGHWNLNPARLPIPPPAHGCCRSILSPAIRAVRSGSSAGAPFDMENISTLQGVPSHPFPAGRHPAARGPPSRLPRAPLSNGSAPPLVPAGHGSVTRPAPPRASNPPRGVSTAPVGKVHPGTPYVLNGPARPGRPAVAGHCRAAASTIAVSIGRRAWATL